MLRPSTSASNQGDHERSGQSGWLCDSCARDQAGAQFWNRLDGFVNSEAAANAAVARESADPQLLELLAAISVEAARESPDIPALISSMEGLLEFLTSPKGSTAGYCRATSVYLGDMRDVSNAVPDSILAILMDMAGAMCNASTHLAAVEAMESTPEQLLSRVRNLRQSFPIG